MTHINMDTSTSIMLHRQGAFDMDNNAIYRLLLVTSLLILIIAVWIIIKILRVKNKKIRVRRYDILSTKQLVSDRTGSDESDDELFTPIRRDERHLILKNTSQ
ncbi:ATP synthase subunit [Dirofilaria immitis]